MTPGYSLPWLLSMMGLGLLLRAFFAVAEFAVGAVDTKRLEQEAAENNVRASRLLLFLARRERILGATMTGSTLAVVAVATAFAMFATQEMPRIPWLPASLVLGLILSLVGEILPRGWAQARATDLLFRLMLPLRIFAFLFSPVIWLVTGSSRLFARIFHGSESGMRAFVTRDELREMLKDGTGEEIKPLERQMLTRVLDFSELTVEEVMIPLIAVHAIQDTTTLRDALRVFIEHGHSRLPVFSDRIDNMVGLIFAFDVLYAENVMARVKTQMRPCKYVPENISIDRVLTDLRKSRMGMAIVVNEYGGAVGLITLEDILEQIVGDIQDEFDRTAPGIRRISPTEFVIDARTRIERLAETLQVDLPEGDYETVGGMMLAELGRIPRVGESLAYGPLVLTVRKATDRAITEIQVVVKPSASSDAP